MPLALVVVVVLLSLTLHPPLCSDFTTKHHEGFSMYDTAANVHDCWDFDTAADAKTIKGIVPCKGNMTQGKGGGHAFSSMEMFGRDVAGELIAAARKGGVEPGLYYSHIDWYDADMRIDQWNAVASAGKLCNGIACDPKKYSSNSSGVNAAQWQRFVLRHRAQVLEVLGKYGDVLEMSFDMQVMMLLVLLVLLVLVLMMVQFPSEFDQDMQDTIMLARLVAPNTLFRGRGMGGYKVHRDSCS